jgi:hypothetical protein
MRHNIETKLKTLQVAVDPAAIQRVVMSRTTTGCGVSLKSQFSTSLHVLDVFFLQKLQIVA